MKDETQATRSPARRRSSYSRSIMNRTSIRRFAVLFVLLVAVLDGSASAETPRVSGIRVVWANGKSETISPDVLKQFEVATPVPGYPREAWPRGGAGLFELRIKKDGGVSGIAVTKSTGEKILDLAAMGALIHYRYKPGVFKKVYAPIIYSVTVVR